MTDELQGLSAFLRAQAYGLQCDVVIPTSTAPNYNPHTLSINCLVQWANAVDELQAARATPADKDMRNQMAYIAAYDPDDLERLSKMQLVGRIQAIIKRARLALDSARATPADHSDDRAVDEFARLMKQKMAVSRAKGRGGWDDPNVCSVGSLSSMLHEHVAKGDPVDVANFCMMLCHYDAKIAPADHSVPVAIHQARRHIDEEKTWSDCYEQTFYACKKFPENYQTRIVYATPQNPADHIEAQSVRGDGEL